jgi:hypothetical protein
MDYPGVIDIKNGPDKAVDFNFLGAPQLFTHEAQGSVACCEKLIVLSCLF